jgi:hypothetical protein
MRCGASQQETKQVSSATKRTVSGNQNSHTRRVRYGGNPRVAQILGQAQMDLLLSLGFRGGEHVDGNPAPTSAFQRSHAPAIAGARDLLITSSAVPAPAPVMLLPPTLRAA